MSTELKAGRELGARVAMGMGWRNIRLKSADEWSQELCGVAPGTPVGSPAEGAAERVVPDFFGSMEAAWPVVELMVARGAAVAFGTDPEGDEAGWGCIFVIQGIDYAAIAPTLPEAICKAFIKVMEGGEG